MKLNGIVKFLLVVFLGGILGGSIFGLMFALCVFGIIYSVEIFIVISVIVFPFYIPGIYRQIKQKTYLVIVRKLVEIIFIASLLNVMFIVEEGIVEFTSFDWNIIYGCVGFVASLFTAFVIIETYFTESWLNKEINHIISGMQIYGLLPIEKYEKVKNISANLED